MEITKRVTQSFTTRRYLTYFEVNWQASAQTIQTKLIAWLYSSAQQEQEKNWSNISAHENMHMQEIS